MMTDLQLLTLALSIIVPLSMLIHSNSRVSDVQKNLGERLTAVEANLNKTLNEMKETLRAEMKTMNAELGGKIDALSTKVDTSMKQHVLEMHK